MARATNTDSRVAARTLVRRDLEIHPGWRAALVLMFAVVGAAIVTHGVLPAVAGAVFLGVALALLALPLFSPERVRRRLLAAASERVPDADGWVTLVGVASEAGELLAAPYSERRCIAYWARAVMADPDDDARDAATDLEQRAASCDFALDVGELRVMVTASDACLAFDRSLGEVVSLTNDALQIEPVTPAHRGRDRREEILLRPGERVIVRGMLVRGTSGAPYRAAARIISGRGRRVAIVLGATVDS